ncbi:MAG: hypothetical protein KQJ78_04465 [Deltaproteobacteria bacterium]|nr:hypothetical protein [Deltaproteobacteria bacterium]
MKEAVHLAEKLWEPSPERVSRANLTRFIALVNQKHGTDFQNYPGL